MTDLVKIVKDVPVVSTLDIWKELGVEHSAIIKMVRKYESEFREIRTFGFEILKSGGRPTPFCHLDEEQATFLITLMKNSPVVVKFKLRLTREFYRMKRFILGNEVRRQNAEYREARDSGKISRGIETDQIKAFVDYATAQGSKNASKYYCNISKMENRALFFIEQTFPNIRDILDMHQLAVIKVADQIVVNALSAGMERNMNYRDIYLLAKEKVEQLGEAHGKTLIPAINQKQIESNPIRKDSSK